MLRTFATAVLEPMLQILTWPGKNSLVPPKKKKLFSSISHPLVLEQSNQQYC